MNSLTPFDDLVNRLTHRFRVDPELQREIAKELRSHLQDSAAEFLAAGANDEDAVSSAVKSLGDETEVAEQLWTANRRRVKWRSAARWAAGVVLAPAAAVACATFAWSSLVSVLVFMFIMQSVGSSIGGNNVPFARRWIERIISQPASASPDNAALLHDPRDASERVTDAKWLADHHFGDSVYWANYVNALLVHSASEVPSALSRDGQAAFQQLLDAIDRGKQVEPENGFYPLVKAGLLFTRSTRYPQDDPAADESTLPGFDYVDPRGKKQRWILDNSIITDQATYDRGLAELHEAAGKSFIDAHAMEMAKRRIDCLPQPTRVVEQLVRLPMEISTLLPYLNTFRMATITGGSHAAEFARQGHAAAATQLVADCRHVGWMLMQRSGLLIDFFVSQGIISDSWAAQAMVDQAVDDKAGFTASVQKMRDMEQARYAVRAAYEDSATLRVRRQESGLIDSILLPAMADPAKTDLAPGRRADYAAADGIGLSVVLLGLTFLATFAGISAVWCRIRRGRWPAVILPGFGKTFAAAGVSTLLPLALYAVYAYLTPIGARQFGTVISLPRLAVEYAMVGGAMLILLRWTTDRFLRRRAVELGLKPVPAAVFSTARRWAGMSVAILGVAYLVYWHFAAPEVAIRDDNNFNVSAWGFTIAAILLLYTVSTAFGRPAFGSLVRGGHRLVNGALWISLAGCIACFRVLLTLHLSYRMNQMVENFIQPALLIIVCAIIAILFQMMVRSLRLREDAAAKDTDLVFSYRLSAVPILMLAMLVLWVAGSIPLKIAERRAVTAMNGPVAGFNLFRELEQSYYGQLRERLLKEGEGSSL